MPEASVGESSVFIGVSHRRWYSLPYAGENQQYQWLLSGVQTGHTMDLRLQPLRIPGGWHVIHNNGLWEVDPLEERVLEADRSWAFKEDMLQMTYPQSHRLLDVGWYPEGNLAEGQYRLVVYDGDFQGRLLHQFDTRDRLKLVDEIERLLAAVCSGKL